MVGVYLIGYATEAVILWGISDCQLSETDYCGGISDWIGNRNSNIVGVYLIK